MSVLIELVSGLFSQAENPVHPVEEGLIGDELSEDDLSEFSSSDEIDDELYSDSQDGEMDERVYEYAALEPGVYLVRVAESRERFSVIVRRSHPLFQFVKSLQENERTALRRAFGTQAASASDPGGVPGVVAHFVAAKLNDPPRFQFYDSDQIEECEPIVDESSSEIDVPPQYRREPAAELFTLDEVDVEYDERLKTLFDLKHGFAPVEMLSQFDFSHNIGNAQPHPAPAFSSETDWFAVKMHYYAMYKAFTELHDRSYTLLMDLVNRRASSTDMNFMFIRSSEGVQYSPEQERAVVERIIEHAQTHSTAENSRARQRTRVAQIAARLVTRNVELGALLKQKQAEATGLLPVYSSESTVLGDVSDDIEKLAEALQFPVDPTPKQSSVDPV